MADVAPLAGAWIETTPLTAAQPERFVAPLAGAWIETAHRIKGTMRGVVAPLAGAWIETNPSNSKNYALIGRAPRGRVD